MKEEKTISYGKHELTILESGSIKIVSDGVEASNTKAALRELSQECGFVFDEAWNTRQLGAKLYEFLKEKSPQKKQESVPGNQETVQEKQEDVPEQKEEPTLQSEEVEASEEESLSSKVRVYGKAQNRTALGIVHAYMVMYPHATLEDLRKAFPNSLNTDSGVKDNFVDIAELPKDSNWNGYFVQEDEAITTGDGKKVGVVSMWTKKSFLKMVAQAKLYDIVVAKFEAADKGRHKGGFRLEYLNGYIPPVPQEKKKTPIWLWIVLALVIIACLLFAFLRPKKVVEVEKIVKVVDTVYVQQLEEIEKNFNAVQFEVGKADLSDDAKFILHDLDKLMQKHPEIKVRIIGHTSKDGTDEYNRDLSERRAKAAVDFLISRGISADRLEYEGKGSSEPIDEERPELNRRTEFNIFE